MNKIVIKYQFKKVLNTSLPSLDLIETFIFLRLKKLRFKHFKIHTNPSKRLRLTPLRTNLKRGSAQNTCMRRRFSAVFCELRIKNVHDRCAYTTRTTRIQTDAKNLLFDFLLTPFRSLLRSLAPHQLKHSESLPFQMRRKTFYYQNDLSPQSILSP